MLRVISARLSACWLSVFVNPMDVRQMSAIIVALIKLMARVQTVELFHCERWSLGLFMSSVLHLGNIS